MSTGRAQAITWSFPDEPNWKLGHFEAGTATPKTIWTDAAKTTPAASPAVADANGGLTLYGDGNYKFTFDSSVDVEIAPDADNFQLTADMATQWEDNFGTAFPVATSFNEMQLFAKRDATKTYLDLGVNLDGTSFESIVAKNADGTFTVFDQQINIKRVIDVKDYGATGDGSTDDATAIQNAFNAVSATGDAVYFPRGIYKCISALTHANDPITVFGDGIGISVLKFTSAAANGFDFNFDTTSDILNMWGLSIYTEKVGGGDAINANWPTAASEYTNCRIKDVEIAPTVALKATAYWTNGIVLSDAKNANIEFLYKGKDSDLTSTSAITLNDACINVTIENLKSSNTATGVLVQGTADNIKINKAIIKYTTTGVDMTFGAAEKLNDVTHCHIEAFTDGITMANNRHSKIIGNTVFKHASSTNNFTGIKLDTSSDNATITGNYIADRTSAGGTEDGIVVIDGDRALIEDNTIEDMDTNAIWLKANATNCQTGVNIINNAGTEYLDSGTGNYYLAEWVYGAISVASAASLTLPNYGTTFSITGVTNINNIAASWVGRTVILVGAVGANFDMLDGNGGTGTIQITFINSAWVQSATLQDNAAT
jgi:hypothetical protein